MRRSLSLLISLIFLGLLNDVVYSESLPEVGKKIITNRFSAISLCIHEPYGIVSSKNQEIQFEFDSKKGKEPPNSGMSDWKGINSHVSAWMDFLVAYGYLKEINRSAPGGIFDNLKITYHPTEKLLPFLGTPDDYKSLRSLMVAKLQLQSIDKVEKRQVGDYNIWRFGYTFFVQPFFHELPRVGPYKNIGEIRYNRLLEKYEIVDYFTPNEGFDLKPFTNRDGKQIICHVEGSGSKNALTIWLDENREKWMSKNQ